MGVTGVFFYFTDEVGIDLPVGAIVPGHVQHARRMTDKQEFHLAAAIDEQGLGIVVKEFGGFLGGQVVHGDSFCNFSILAYRSGRAGIAARSGIIGA
jgi:hypothetical protein